MFIKFMFVSKFCKFRFKSKIIVAVFHSWGKFWGMDGYIRMAKNLSNNCGIATRPSYPVV